MIKRILQSQTLKNLAVSVKPWVIFIGIFFVLKVTGLGREVSMLAQTALLKAGVVDIEPENDSPKEQSFSYDFSVKDLDGKTLDMSDLKGKVIFLNLWATWCGPCRVEMPSIQNLYNAVDPEKIAFVMLSLDQENDRAKIRKFVSDKEFSFPVYQPATPLPKLLRVTTIPTTFIISPDGKVKSKKTGMANYDTDEMREFLKQLSE